MAVLVLTIGLINVLIWYITDYFAVHMDIYRVLAVLLTPVLQQLFDDVFVCANQLKQCN